MWALRLKSSPDRVSTVPDDGIGSRCDAVAATDGDDDGDSALGVRADDDGAARVVPRDTDRGDGWHATTPASHAGGTGSACRNEKTGTLPTWT